MLDGNRETSTGSSLHFGLGESKQVHGVDTGLRWQDTFLCNLPSAHKYGAYCCGYSRTFTHPLPSRRHRENISVLSAVLVSLNHNLETTHRLGKPGLLQQPLPLGKYMGNCKFQRDNLMTLDIDGFLVRDAQPYHSFYQLGISRRQYQPQVGYPLNTLQILGQGYGLRMRIAVDIVCTHIFKLDPLLQCLPAILKEIHRGKFAIEKHRYAYLHGMNPVLNNGRPLHLLATMCMVYVYRLNLVEQRIGAEPGQNISHPRKAP